MTVAMTGNVPGECGARPWGVDRAAAKRGGDRHLGRASGAATITVEFASRSDLRRLAPDSGLLSWCRTSSSLAEYRKQARVGRGRLGPEITVRERAAVFIPADTSPQEVRDCLHEELAQALGPLNDLYRLS